MFSCRGIGAAIGPVLIRKWFGDSPKVLQWAIAIAFFLGSLTLYAFSLSNSLLSASLSIGLLGMFGSIVWVFST
ncbi:MAG: MFS transporter, partial [Nitrospinaceae bacterium]